jgi:hypothetical protein
VQELQERLNSLDTRCGEKDNTHHEGNGGKDEEMERPIRIKPTPEPWQNERLTPKTQEWRQFLRFWEPLIGKWMKKWLRKG